MSFAQWPENAPIHDLQTMLFTVQPDRAPLRDGLYGKETQEAVLEFQRRNGLAQSGIVHEETWNLLTERYKEAEVLRGQAEPLQILLQPGQVLPVGSDNLHVYLLQGMLLALGQLYEELPLPAATGILDDDTARALRFLQQRFGIEDSGALDKQTWRHLARQYRSAVGDGSGSYPVRRTAPVKE